MWFTWMGVSPLSQSVGRGAGGEVMTKAEVQWSYFLWGGWAGIKDVNHYLLSFVVNHTT